MVKVGTCLLGNCQKALAGCLTDVGCIKDLACLQSCNGRPDEIDCQVRRVGRARVGRAGGRGLQQRRRFGVRPSS